MGRGEVNGVGRRGRGELNGDGRIVKIVKLFLSKVCTLYIVMYISILFILLV